MVMQGYIALNLLSEVCDFMGTHTLRIVGLAHNLLSDINNSEVPNLEARLKV
jgi:hypothetical protein